MLYSKSEVTEKIEQFVKKAPEERAKYPIFCNLKLPDMEVRGITFENAFFENIDVMNFNFFNCVFKDCKFAFYSNGSLNFNYCKLENCEFQSGGEGVHLYKSEITSSKFENNGSCVISDSKLSDSKIYVNILLARNELHSCTIHGSIHDIKDRFIFDSKLYSCSFSITYEELGFVPPAKVLAVNVELFNCGFDQCFLNDCVIYNSRLENCSFTNGLEEGQQNFFLRDSVIKNLVEDRTYDIVRSDCIIEESDPERNLSIIESALQDAGVDTKSLTIGNNSIQVWGSTIWIPNTEELLKDGSLLDSYVRVIQKIEKDRGL